MKLLLTISFDGTDFKGYQVQRNGRTVQAELNRACEELFGKPCDAVGCSRTDSGVHAKMFCVAITEKGRPDLCSSLSAEKAPDALNAHLPDDISVNRAKWVDDGFHPRYAVVSKEYVYRIYNGRYRSPFLDRYSCHCPYGLDADRMNEAASFFEGTHDFRAFMAAGSKIKDTRRHVFSASVSKEGDMILFSVRADGFLYNMVRIMAGTLVDAGTGRIRPEDVKDIIRSGERRRAGKTMPPQGLFLADVEYPKE
ncbi:MAG: tRNA pseudouridine(38-40) synthase TruA [Clostridia bacterium]|nr:tRNA pseudouridine(38-40) synthase TruA [Clostridia bacterium]